MRPGDTSAACVKTRPRMTTIRTRHLVLRDFLESDLDAYIALRSDAKFQRFYSEGEASPEKSAQLLRLFMQQATELPRTRFQLAIVSADGDLMGSCGIRVETPGHASLGCELGRRWHSSGAAREACAAMLAFGFDSLHLHRVYAETIAENKAAIALCQAIGMRIEAERVNAQQFKGRSWNTIVLALAADDWHAGRLMAN